MNENAEKKGWITCVNCKHKLFRVTPNIYKRKAPYSSCIGIEIKCSSCGTINNITPYILSYIHNADYIYNE
jgi:hypothetical protein